MTFPGSGDFVCSASVIRPHLLVTAAHCLLDGGTWATNVVFYRGYHNGRPMFRPHNPAVTVWRPQDAGYVVKY